jgi:putative transcriptional regulator
MEVKKMELKIQQIRESKGISQTFLSQKLGFSHPSGYCNIEKGRNRLSLEHAIIIADLLDVKIEDLYFKKVLDKTAKIS